MSAFPSPAVDPSGDDVPLSIEPIVGWRVWRLVQDSDGEFALSSLTRPDEWPASQSMKATCSSHHQSPGETCGCGIYAASSIHDLAASGVFHSNAGVIGAIAMWGKVVEHQRGARSAFAYPARLRLVCAPCLQMRRIVDPVKVVGDRGRVVPMCSVHLMKNRAKGAPAGDVQSQLLSTYGIELLPKPELPRLSRYGLSVPPRKPGMVVLTAIGMLLRFLIGAIFALIFWGGLLLLAFSVVWGAISSMFGWNEQAPAPVASIAYPTRIVVPTPFGPSAVEHGHRRPVVPPPPPTPQMAFPCGISHGIWIELVPCDSRDQNVMGIGERTSPRGHLKDCFGISDAYSTGENWWVCWFSVSHASVDPKPTSPNPFKAPRELGGIPRGDR